MEISDVFAAIPDGKPGSLLFPELLQAHGGIAQAARKATML
ncbi:hypothetical protein [Mesorhizobium sp. KR9-304]